jgi:hypothetical protein
MRPNSAALEPQKMKSVKDWIAESVFEYLTTILLSDSHEGLQAFGSLKSLNGWHHV